MSVKIQFTAYLIKWKLAYETNIHETLRDIVAAARNHCFNVEETLLSKSFIGNQIHNVLKCNA